MGRVGETVDGQLLRGTWLCVKCGEILAQLGSEGQEQGLARESSEEPN